MKEKLTIEVDLTLSIPEQILYLSRAREQITRKLYSLRRKQKRLQPKNQLTID